MFWIPTGFDRADGTTELPSQPTGSGGAPQKVGLPSPASDILPNGDTSIVNEEPDSPEIERAEQATFQHRLKTSWQNCLNLIAVLGRGTFVTDSFGNIWRVLSSKINAIRSGDGTSKMGSLSVVAESISFDSPPDDFQMIPVELGIDILKHPRYSWALLPFVSDQSTFTLVGDTRIYYVDIKESIVRAIQSYRDSPFYPNADQVNGLIQNNIISQIGNGFVNVTVPNPNYLQPNGISSPASPATWDGTNASLASIPNNVQNLVVSVPVNLANADDPIAIAISAAKELISKLWRQEDTPYVVGFQVTWSQYFFAPVYENPGGYVENPIGIVPDYFMSPSQDGSNTIFDQMVSINPQSYSQDGLNSGNLDISWLRKADEVEYQRTWFKITRTWIGSPVGHWDNQLYPTLGSSRPQNANDFNGLPT